MPRLLRTAGALSLLALPFLGGVAHADTTSPSGAASDPSDSASASASAAAGPAGSSFRTAGQLAAGQTAQASGAVGDYFYWAFQARAGQVPSVTATVQLPSGSGRQGAETWRLDVYDGLRRVQPCVSGSPQAQATTDAASVQLSCMLPSVRDWAETWSDDPLPGTYYVRLTVGDLAEQDLGLPVSAQVGLAMSADSGSATGGSLSAPLSLPSAGPSASAAPAATDGAATAQSPDATTSAAPAADGSSSGFFSGLFSGGNARWWWTGGGAVVASLAGVLGFTLTRHPRRWFS